MRYIILGTAGHIDHGKSALVKALTGIDPDRLKEEKERGITIDIGFADIEYPENDLTIGIVDVPGHEKLINNMLAGAGGIDMVLLVIAADEGIMPQSREHLAICNLLGIMSGLTVITKSDLVEKDWIELVRDEIRDFVKGTFLENAPIIPVSSKTGENLDIIKNEIRDIALKTPQKTSGGPFRLPIDRVFTLKGFGTVITGTAMSGSISTDEPLEILPANIRTKVRGLHSHGRALKTARAGQRVAVNLQAVEKEDISRGDVAVSPAGFLPSKKIDVFLEMLKDTPVLKNRGLVHFYIGTSETVARVILYEREELRPGENGYCQFRLQDPVLTMSGDRYIIRRFSPLETLGGGVILDPTPHKRRRKDGIEDLKILHNGSLNQKISLKTAKAGRHCLTVNAINSWISSEPGSISEAISQLSRSDEIILHENLLLHKNAFEQLQKKISELLNSFHKNNPLRPGMPKEEVRNILRIDPKLFNFILTRLTGITTDKNLLRVRDFKIALSHDEESLKKKILELLEKGGFQPPVKGEISEILKIEQKQMTDLLNILVKEGSIVRINDTMYLASTYFKKMLALLKAFYSKKTDMTVAEFRDMLDTTRKYALPFLEYLDSGNITLRKGDVRKFISKG